MGRPRIDMVDKTLLVPESQTLPGTTGNSSQPINPDNLKILENPLVDDPSLPIADSDMGESSDYNAFYDKADQIEDRIIGKKHPLKTTLPSNTTKTASTPSTPNKKKQRQKDILRWPRI